MNPIALLQLINFTSAGLDLLAQYNISEQKLIELKAAKNGEPFTADDLAKLSNDAQKAIDSIT